jgi:hypothetical protein
MEQMEGVPKRCFTYQLPGFPPPDRVLKFCIIWQTWPTVVFSAYPKVPGPDPGPLLEIAGIDSELLRQLEILEINALARISMSSRGTRSGPRSSVASREFKSGFLRVSLSGRVISEADVNREAATQDTLQAERGPNPARANRQMGTRNGRRGAGALPVRPYPPSVSASSRRVTRDKLAGDEKEPSSRRANVLSPGAPL